ncbi:hypothetical protein NL676_022995 [Syzygium grande]|nr:hypothetical protein NL676_022995 [Syzygium grande]
MPCLPPSPDANPPAIALAPVGPCTDSFEPRSPRSRFLVWQPSPCSAAVQHALTSMVRAYGHRPSRLGRRSTHVHPAYMVGFHLFAVEPMPSRRSSRHYRPSAKKKPFGTLQ